MVMMESLSKHRGEECGEPLTPFLTLHSPTLLPEGPLGITFRKLKGYLFHALRLQVYGRMKDHVSVSLRTEGALAKIKERVISKLRLEVHGDWRTSFGILHGFAPPFPTWKSSQCPSIYDTQG